MSVPLRFRTRDWNAKAEKVCESSLAASDEKQTDRRDRALVTGGLIAAVVLAGYVAWRWLEAIGGVGALSDRFGFLAPLVSSAIGDALPERAHRRCERQRVRALARDDLQLDRLVVRRGSRIHARTTRSPGNRVD
jgi:hypothetical protein